MPELWPDLTVYHDWSKSKFTQMLLYANVCCGLAIMN